MEYLAYWWFYVLNTYTTYQLNRRERKLPSVASSVISNTAQTNHHKKYSKHHTKKLISRSVYAYPGLQARQATPDRSPCLPVVSLAKSGVIPLGIVSRDDATSILSKLLNVLFFCQLIFVEWYNLSTAAFLFNVVISKS